MSPSFRLLVGAILLAAVFPSAGIAQSLESDSAWDIGIHGGMIGLMESDHSWLASPTVSWHPPQRSGRWAIEASWTRPIDVDLPRVERVDLFAVSVRHALISPASHPAIPYVEWGVGAYDAAVEDLEPFTCPPGAICEGVPPETLVGGSQWTGLLGMGITGPQAKSFRARLGLRIIWLVDEQRRLTEGMVGLGWTPR
jgi:hypothetical protein